MKNVAYAALFLFLGASLPTVKAQVSATSAPKPQLTRAMIAVSTLQTQDQATALKADLKAAKGITYAEVELQNKKVIVAFDALTTTVAEVNAFIEGKGYKTEILYPKQNTTAPAGK
jgi:copper chaperone CopZ